MSPLHAWALRWGISAPALRDLQAALGLTVPALPEPRDPAYAKSEAWVQSAVRLEAAEKGVRLWRNNVGAFKDESGRWVRYGLANDSGPLNKVLKSGDLIGWRPVVITQAHVGHKVAQFVSREIKEAGWTYKGTEREAAQLNWANLIHADGGDAGFATGRGTL